MADWLDAAFDTIAAANTVTILSLDEMEKVIREHAPQWRDRPMCAGWWMWVTVLSNGVVRNEPGLCGFCLADPNTLCEPKLTRWYGPIPEAPKGEQT